MRVNFKIIAVSVFTIFSFVSTTLKAQDLKTELPKIENKE